ncbi:MAG: hypothetical protein IE885_01750 [Campylobacterales bacterium]|nr:hypothetical protein [Campylobacterales bacterium]
MEEKKDQILSKVGVEIGEEKINIDIGKTKEFFTDIQKQFTQTAQVMSEGKIDMPETVGVKVDDEQLHIDLHKAQHFIEELGKKIEKFLGEIDQAVEKLDRK